MFTGIIQAVGKVESQEKLEGDVRLAIDIGELKTNLEVGDSIAVNGVCLTVADRTKTGFITDVSTETLSLTVLGKLQRGAAVNLETALTISTPLGGHVLNGHVDGIGEILIMEKDARSVRFEFAVPTAITQYMATKGSVAIDGVSLTINKVVGNNIGINVLPHTLENTVFSEYDIGRQVNVEVDIIARYLERLASSGALGDGITWQGLRQHGFINDDGNQ